MEIHTSNTPAQEAGQRINALLDEYRNTDVLLLLSGGSALSLLEHINTTPMSERVTISVLDERFTYDSAVSNFSQLIATPFWERATKQHVQAIDPRPDSNESLVDTARRFDIALKHWHIIHRDGIGIATLGIGADGHTSGILPHQHNPETFVERFSNTHHCVVGYHVDPRINPYPDRMTTAPTYLKRHIHHAVVYAVGEEKRPALEAVLHENGMLHETPARVIRDMRDVQLYTDITLRYS